MIRFPADEPAFAAWRARFTGNSALEKIYFSVLSVASVPVQLTNVRAPAGSPMRLFSPSSSYVRDAHGTLKLPTTIYPSDIENSVDLAVTVSSELLNDGTPQLCLCFGEIFGHGLPGNNFDLVFEWRQQRENGHVQSTLVEVEFPTAD